MKYAVGSGGDSPKTLIPCETPSSTKGRAFPSDKQATGELWFSNPAERGALASRLLPNPKNRCKNKIDAKNNLAQAVWRATVAPNENHRDINQLS
jgi:hypothetical protein